MEKLNSIIVVRNNNPYYENNPVLFEELFQVVDSHPRSFVNILTHKHTYLIEWAEKLLPALHDPFYKLNTKVHWILAGVTDFPKCAGCGQNDGMRARNVKVTAGYPKYCCNRCQVTSAEFKRARIATWERKYGKGVTSPSKSAKVQARQRATCLRNHGVEHPMQSREIFKKGQAEKARRYGDPNFINQAKARVTRFAANGGKWESSSTAEARHRTCRAKYGVDNVAQSTYFKEKTLRTSLEKYGTQSPNQAEVVKAKKRLAFERHYGEGIVNYSQTQEFKNKFKDLKYVKQIQQKVYNAKRINGTFNSSRPEDETYARLKAVFPDLIRQYKSEQYPFACDFYSPAAGLYMEYNGTWTHGGQPYDPGDPVCEKRLAAWKAKHTRYYDNAIKTWTVRDPAKFRAAADHNLNYVVFWSLDDVDTFISAISL